MTGSPPAEDATREQQAPQSEPQKNRSTKRPLVERVTRTPSQSFKLHWCEAVDVGVDCGKLRAVLGAEKLTGRRTRDLAESGQVDAIITRRIRVTEPDCIDDHTFLAGDVGGVFRWYAACRVISVCKQNDELLFGLAGFKRLDGETYG